MVAEGMGFSPLEQFCAILRGVMDEYKGGEGGAGGENVFFYYPPKTVLYPCVSYYEINNSAAVISDGSRYCSEVSVMADVWAKRPELCQELAEKISAAMEDEDWTEQYRHDLYDGVYRKTMRFTALFCNN